jgi:hypothetical protein
MKSSKGGVLLCTALALCLGKAFAQPEFNTSINLRERIGRISNDLTKGISFDAGFEAGVSYVAGRESFNARLYEEIGGTNPFSRATGLVGAILYSSNNLPWIVPLVPSFSLSMESEIGEFSSREKHTFLWRMFVEYSGGLKYLLLKKNKLSFNHEARMGFRVGSALGNQLEFYGAMGVNQHLDKSLTTGDDVYLSFMGGMRIPIIP